MTLLEAARMMLTALEREHATFTRRIAPQYLRGAVEETEKRQADCHHQRMIVNASLLFCPWCGKRLVDPVQEGDT